VSYKQVQLRNGHSKISLHVTILVHFGIKTNKINKKGEKMKAIMRQCALGCCMRILVHFGINEYV